MLIEKKVSFRAVDTKERLTGSEVDLIFIVDRYMGFFWIGFLSSIMLQPFHLFYKKKPPLYKPRI